MENKEMLIDVTYFDFKMGYCIEKKGINFYEFEKMLGSTYLLRAVVHRTNGTRETLGNYVQLHNFYQKNKIDYPNKPVKRGKKKDDNF